jgi:hypothetical protein
MCSTYEWNIHTKCTPTSQLYGRMFGDGSAQFVARSDLQHSMPPRPGNGQRLDVLLRRTSMG